MNRQTFLRYLEQPTLLEELSLAELQGLALEYPYSANIRLLLLLKAKSEKHTSTGTYLNRCASAMFDRPALFDLLRDHPTRATPESPEVLELIELDELELAPLTVPIVSDLPSKINAMEAPAPEFEHVREVEEATELYDRKEYVLKSDLQSWIDVSTGFSEVLVDIFDGFEQENVGDVPEDPSIFADLLFRKRTETSLGDRLRKLRRLREPETVPNELDQIVNRSVVDRGAVASETLAALLVRQEQYQTAIKMYRRLILLYPEKKAIFAGLIKELKEKL